MYGPEDALLLIISDLTRGRHGPAVDAYELASRARATRNADVPHSPAAINRIIGGLWAYRFVRYCSRAPDPDRGPIQYRSVALTEDGRARVRELRLGDQRPPARAPSP
jgi:hypothetical protein